MKQTKKQIMEGLTGVTESKIVANNTVKYTDDRGEHIRLHNTDIISFIKGKTVLNSGGWRTVTTKERMSQFLPKHYYVQQEKSVWYLVYRRYNKDYSKLESHRKYVFADGITINKNGSISNHGGKPDKLHKLNKQIGAYVKDYIKELFARNVPEPSGGDCWHCCMRDTKTGKPMGGSDHLLEHMKEKYYVPSLLVNAIKAFDVGTLIKGTVARIWKGEPVSDWLVDVSKRQLTSSLRRYMKSQLGLAG